MFTLPLGLTAAWIPGAWYPWLFGPQRTLGAAVVCPDGHAFSIGGGQPFGSVHEIRPGGAVQPSVICPHCGWHVNVQLVGWK